MSLRVMDPFDKAPQKFSYRILVAPEERAGGDDSGGGKVEPQRSDIGELPESVPTDQSGKFGAQHGSVRCSTLERQQVGRHAAILNDGEIPAAFHRPLFLGVAESKIAGRPEPGNADLFAFKIFHSTDLGTSHHKKWDDVHHSRDGDQISAGKTGTDYRRPGK